MNARYVGVHLLEAPFQIDREYAYFLPAEFAEDVRVGSVVAVPFGAANRRAYALVSSLSEKTEMEKLKPVMAVLPDRFSLTEEMRGLCFFMKDHTLCSVGDAVRCLLPGTAFSAIRELYYPGVGMPEEETVAAACRLVQAEGCVEAERLKSECDLSGARLGSLVEDGFLTRSYELKEEKGKVEKVIRLAASDEEILSLLDGKKKLRSEAHERILRTMLAEEYMRRADLCEATHTTTAQVNALVKRGLLAEEEAPLLRDPYADVKRVVDRSPIVLSRAQGAAYDTLVALLREDAPRAALLHGVTGSGKTKVMMKLIDETIASGKSAILMVPEIALTPQTVGIFCARYGDRVAVIHSSLGDGERFDAWQRIASGEIDLVIGTRSAVFAPLSNLGLVVMDEEHEHTYKSENDPKYHTRDVAAYRCGVHHALMLLASATPSLESYYKAERGQYTLVSLRERYGGARLPEAEIVDMRQELRAGNRSSVSRRLQELLEETVEREEQAILFLNRRGFHTSISCKSCGEPLTCPHCSIALTHHTDRVGGSSLCHCCGYRAATPRTCPSCGSDQLSFVGFGTQKAEGEIASCLPNASVLRMDADTTKGKQAHDRLLESFRRGEANVLLGTQMVTKGHDFPHVSLSGVMLADTSLYVNDFRASERTFALLTQVIGRAGRAESPGRAVIQTYTPENETIRLACLQDYESFYKSEIALRRSLSFPPFCDLVQLTISSAYEDELMTASVRLSSFMSSLAKREFSDLPLIIFGPFEAGVYKVAGKYRLRMVVKCRLCKQSRAYFSRVLIDFSKEIGHRIHVSLDMNPM
jgi:primosomal protein N' (replication factor Y)